MTVQQKYWNELLRIKFEIFYLEGYIGQSYKMDSSINFTTAIASSSSIAAWVIWNKIGFIWSIVIAISQVINAIKVYLPYNKRIKTFTSLYMDMSDIFTKAEYNWFKVSNGDLASEEINDLHFELKKECQKVQKKYLLNEFLPINERIKKVADRNTEIYFQNNY